MNKHIKITMLMICSLMIAFLLTDYNILKYSILLANAKLFGGIIHMSPLKSINELASKFFGSISRIINARNKTIGISDSTICNRWKIFSLINRRLMSVSVFLYKFITVTGVWYVYNEFN